MPLRLFIPLAGLVLAALLAPVSAPGQQLRFEHKKYDVAPGDTVEVRLMAEGAGDLSGLNFTLRIAAEDAERVRIMEATSFVTLSFNQFRYSDHRLERSGIDSGLITGDVAELRGVLYSHLAEPATFSTTPARHVASVYLPVDLYARGRVAMEIVEGTDNAVHLLGMADAQGEKVANPQGDFATIVIRRSGEPMVTDFREPRTWPGWRYISSWPQDGSPHPIGEAIPGEGLTIRTTMPNSFAEWQWNVVDAGAWRTPRAGALLVTDWLMTSTHTATDNPGVRLRHLTQNSMGAFELVFSDIDGNNDGIDVSPTPQGRTYRTIVEIPDYAARGSDFDGISPFFDTISVGDLGTRPGRLALAKLTERVVDPSALRGRRTEYYQVFSTRDGGGWWFDSGLSAGREVSYSRGRNGLGITSGGPLIEDPSSDLGIAFSAGIWVAPFEVIDVTASANRWYRLEGEVISTAQNPLNSPAVRLRAFPPGNEMFFMAQHYPGVDLDSYQIERASLESTPVNLWFQVPPEYDGLPITIGFDMIHTDGAAQGSESTPTVFLKWVRLTSYDQPELRPVPQER